jgi:peptide deformylase
MIVVGLPNNRDDENYKFLIMINPDILEYSDIMVCDEE